MDDATKFLGALTAVGAQFGFGHWFAIISCLLFAGSFTLYKCLPIYLKYRKEDRQNARRHEADLKKMDQEAAERERKRLERQARKKG